MKSKKKEDPLTNKDKLVIVSIFIIAAIFGLILTSIKSNEEPEIITKEYNGFVFTKVDKIWRTKLRLTDKWEGWTRDYEIFFHFTPDEVADVPSIHNTRNESTAPKVFLNAKKIYITTDPKYPAEVVLSGVEIAKIISKVYEQQVEAATTKPDNRTDAPVITCNDMDMDTRIIHLKLGEQTRIYSDQGCIVVEGTTPRELLRASEKLTYEMLKIL